MVKTDYTIETKRLIMRPVREEDYEAITEALNTPYVADLLSFVRLPWTTKDTRSKFEEWLSSTLPEYPFVGVDKETAVYVGSANLHFRSESQAEIGNWVHPQFYRQGFGYEIAQANVDFAFQEADAEELYATCDLNNEPSYKLLEKLGMQRRDDISVDTPQGPRPSRYYVLEKSSWLRADREGHRGG